MLEQKNDPNATDMVWLEAPGRYAMALLLILLPIKDKIHHFVFELPFQRPITKPQKRQCYSHFNVPLLLWSSVKLQDDGLASP